MTQPRYGYVPASGGSGGGAVSSVAGRAGDVVLGVTDVTGAQPTMTTQSKTASFTAAAGVVYLVDTTTSAVTATLPAANVAGQKIALKWVGGTNTATVTRSGSDTIGSATTSAQLVLLNEIWELTSSGGGQWNLTGGNKTLSSLDARYTPHGLTTGEETMSRELLTNVAAATPSSGQLRLSYFTCRKSELTTQVRVWTGSVAAAATPTLCRIGLYTAADTGALTGLVASTANDTTLFASVNTSFTRSWTTPYQKIAGQRYALGLLVVSAATMPTFAGQSTMVEVVEIATAPAITTLVPGQSDLPSTVAVGSLSQTGQRFYGAILP